MTDDLIKNHLRVGMPRVRVFSLLGPPDDRYLGLAYGWVVGRYHDCIHQVVVAEFARQRLRRFSLLTPPESC